MNIKCVRILTTRMTDSVLWGVMGSSYSPYSWELFSVQYINEPLQYILKSTYCSLSNLPGSLSTINTFYYTDERGACVDHGSVIYMLIHHWCNKLHTPIYWSQAWHMEWNDIIKSECKLDNTMHSTLLLLCLCEDGGTITESTKGFPSPPVLILLYNDKGENNTDILPIQQCCFGAVGWIKGWLGDVKRDSTTVEDS